MKEKKDVVLYKILRPIITILFKIVYTPKIIGKNNIPKEGRVILAGNHTNNLDCAILISSTKRNIHFLAKKELWNGFKKILFGNMGLIPVDRSIHDHSAFNSAIEYLNNDLVIGIFPEGTITKGDNLLPFKYGAVKMAEKTNSVIVPFIITGKYKIFSRDLKIEFLNPININKENIEEENNKLYNLINNRWKEQK